MGHAAAGAPFEVTVEQDVACRLRDGVVLRADVYRPRAGVPVPVLLLRLPYGKRVWRAEGVPAPGRLAAAGYLVVLQDVRGRHASDGAFGDLAQEARDGHDAVRWAAALPGSTGAVGTFGPSYLAHAQWAAALEHPAALAAMVVMHSPGHSAIDGQLVRGGVPELGSRLGWAHGAIALDELLRRPDLTERQAVEAHAGVQGLFDSGEIYRHRPFRDLDLGEAILREATRVWGEPLDALGEHTLTTQGRYDELPQPAFLVAGWYDVFLGSTLAQYEGMSRRPGRPVTHLVVGPWSHLEAGRRLGDVDFGAAASHTDMGDDLALEEQHVRWFDATLKGEGQALADLAPVRLFVMGTDRWVPFDSFPPPAEATAMYLTAGGGLTPTRPVERGEVRYDYDPESPAPTNGGTTLMAGFAAGPKDQRELQGRDDVVSFASDVLARPVTVVGYVGVTLFASTTAVDTDFVVRLCDDRPDGSSVNLADGVIRASARESYDHHGPLAAKRPTPVVPGEVLEYRFNLWATAHTFLPGHRIRVDVTSSCFPRWDPNLNTGRSSWDSAESVPATQTIHVGPGAASRIHLPVVTIPDPIPDSIPDPDSMPDHTSGA